MSQTGRRGGAGIRDAQAWSVDQVGYSMLDKQITWRREGRNTRSNVHRDPGKVVTYNFAFSGVQATAYFKVEGTHPVADRAGAADRPRRAIESGQKAIACSADFTASVKVQR